MSTSYYVDGAVGNDSNAGTSPGSGNAWLTIDHALATILAGDLANVKASATYSIATGLTMAQSSTAALTKLIGYTTTPGDGGKATIQASAAITGLTMSGYGCRVENLIFDGASTGTIGVSMTGLLSNTLINCKVENWTSMGLSLDPGAANGCTVIGTEVTGCTGSQAVNCTGSGAWLFDCAVHDNTTIGVTVSSVGSLVDTCQVYSNGSHGINAAAISVTVIGSKIYGNSGSGIFSTGDDSLYIRNCTIHSNTNDGIHTDTFWLPNAIVNNIFTSNGGYGLNAAGMSPAMSDDAVNYNWFGTGGLANTSGPRNIILAGPNDLSGDPQYVNAAAGNFTPQNSAVQAAFPSGWIGAVQPSGGNALVLWMEG